MSRPLRLLRSYESNESLDEMQVMKQKSFLSPCFSKNRGAMKTHYGYTILMESVCVVRKVQLKNRKYRHKSI